ncbi:putative signal transducing protein [Flavobacterium sp. '19STA2R22 D10 B1']|uniref:putative signal transducing protein n=1 Tax=Flavobacterium aerium TaxID=3037261 RepID=UPI00278BE299|nr:DUF2007 domain-containing protein [Flavobacterium sp. '19STA2R22 D10 B1']
MEDFVTVAVFNYPHEIAILKHLLDEAEIQYVFENETMTSIVPFYSQALGGIKLKVHPNDIELVQKILAEMNDQDHLKIV